MWLMVWISRRFPPSGCRVARVRATFRSGAGCRLASGRHHLEGNCHMRAGFGQFNVPTDEYLQYAAQFGATDVLLNTPVLPGGARWELYDLVKLRMRVESFGLKLTALETVPTRFYDQIMLNG